MPILPRTLPVFPLLLLTASILLLSSCRGSHVELTPEYKDSIATVTVKDEIGMPEKAFYSGPASGLGAFIGGVIGSLIVQSAEDADDLLTQVLATEEVNLEAIVREEIHRSFVASNPVGTVVDAGGDAEFQFNVDAYGLHKHGWGILDVRPLVYLEAKLVKRDGSVVWEKTEGPAFMDDIPVQSFEEWMNDLDALREGFRRTVRFTVAYLIEDLKEDQ